jgi:ABC-type lipopolysaccharide export system ATPase subunit
MKGFNFQTISTECNIQNNNKIKYLLKALNDFSLDIIVTERNKQDNHKIIRASYTLKGPIHPEGSHTP